MLDNISYVGKQFGSYIAIEQLSAIGGYGRLYKGKHIIFSDRPIVVIKLLSPNLTSKKEKDRFIQEARLLERLKHPFIMPIIDAGIEDELEFLIAEYAPNGSLKESLQKQAPNPLPIEDTMMIISHIGQALQYSHRLNIVHRDLKPDNILFNAKGQALLADFGIAVVLDAARTKSGEILGTPPYMAPEQFDGKASTKSDQYALACITYELVTGSKPFTLPRGAHIAAWAAKHATEIPTPPRQLNPYVPLHIEQAILKAMAKNRDERYSDISAFLTALGVSFSQRTTHFTSELNSSNTESSEINSVSEISTMIESKKLRQQWLAEGDAHYKAKHFEDALSTYEQVIRLDPKYTQAYYRIGKVLEQLNRPWEAIAAYDQAIIYNPSFVHAYIGKGDIYIAIFKQHEKALEEYQKATSVAPKVALGYFKMGKALTELNRPEEALHAYESALRFDQNPIDTYYAMIDLLVNIQRYDDALVLYDRMIQHSPKTIDIYYKKLYLLMRLQRFNDAITTYDQIIQLAPNVIDTYYQKIKLLEYLKRYDDILITYDWIIQRTPNSIDVYLKIAELQVSGGRYNDAITTYNQIIQQFPNVIDTYYQKIYLLERQQKNDEALATYDQIIQRIPNPTKVYHDKIHLLERLGRFDEALTNYERIIQRFPNQIDTYYQKIRLLESQQKNDEALATYERIIQRFPNEIDAYYQKIHLLKDLRRYDEALMTYDQIIQHVSNPINFYYEKIQLLEELKRFDGILTTYDQIIRLDPGSTDVYFTKAALLERLEHYEDALATYDQIIKLAPNLVNAYYRRGRTLESFGKTEEFYLLIHQEPVPDILKAIIDRLFPNQHFVEALKGYNQALQLSPNNPTYQTSVGDILNALGKRNEVKRLNREYQSWSTKFPDRVWLSIFFVINALCISIPLGIWLHSIIVFIVIFGAISILSASIAILIKKIDKPYHLYDAKILLLPCLFFGLGWACISWFITFSLFFSFVVLMIGSLAISFGAFLVETFGIDIYKRAALSIINYIKETQAKWKEAQAKRREAQAIMRREAQAKRLNTNEIQTNEMEPLIQKRREAQAKRLNTNEIQANEMEPLIQNMRNYRKNKDSNIDEVSLREHLLDQNMRNYRKNKDSNDI